MSPQDERTRILDLLASGQITTSQASALLEALGGDPPPPRAATARTLRISIDAKDAGGGKAGPRIRVNVPLGLAKFALRFMPAEARSELDARGIDLADLIAALPREAPDGKLVDIDVDDESGGKTVKIVIEIA
jgi:hypothetical protein